MSGSASATSRIRTRRSGDRACQSCKENAAPVLALPLLMRFRSRQSDSFGAKAIAALRNKFGGHAVKPIAWHACTPFDGSSIVDSTVAARCGGLVGMMSHMMGHMQAGAASMAMCPMMKQMGGKKP